MVTSVFLSASVLSNFMVMSAGALTSNWTFPPPAPCAHALVQPFNAASSRILYSYVFAGTFLREMLYSFSFVSDFTKFGVALASQPVPGSVPTRRKVVSVFGRSGTGFFPSASR